MLSSVPSSYAMWCFLVAESCDLTLAPYHALSPFGSIHSTRTLFPGGKTSCGGTGSNVLPASGSGARSCGNDVPSR